MFVLVEKALDITPSFAAACGGGNFFGLPHWWQYLTTSVDAAGNCNVNFNFPNDIWLIALALLEILLRIGGMVAVVMIIVAGFRYVTSAGNTDKAVSARKTAINALIGLGVTLVAASVVAFIGNRIG